MSEDMGEKDFLCLLGLHTLDHCSSSFGVELMGAFGFASSWIHGSIGGVGETAPAQGTVESSSAMAAATGPTDMGVSKSFSSSCILYKVDILPSSSLTSRLTG